MSTDRAARITRWLTPSGDVLVPARVARRLEKDGRLTADYRIGCRNEDPLTYEVLIAMRLAALASSDRGTERDSPQPRRPESDHWMTTSQAAEELGVTDRAVRKWIATQRLSAESHGGRWLIHRHDLDAFKLTA